MQGRVAVKWCGTFHESWIDHSPLDIVAWHGNDCPYKYDLRIYFPVGAILFDHPDPSIFTVLTAPSRQKGTANIDFVLFRERWMVAEHSFRPPWHHKNLMSGLMGNIYGIYDAKPEGLVPGGMSLHNCMLPHGPDRNAFEAASSAELKPEKLDNTDLEKKFDARRDRSDSDGRMAVLTHVLETAEDANALLARERTAPIHPRNSPETAPANICLNASPVRGANKDHRD